MLKKLYVIQSIKIKKCEFKFYCFTIGKVVSYYDVFNKLDIFTNDPEVFLQAQIFGLLEVISLALCISNFFHIVATLVWPLIHLMQRDKSHGKCLERGGQTPHLRMWS